MMQSRWNWGFRGCTCRGALKEVQLHGCNLQACTYRDLLAEVHLQGFTCTPRFCPVPLNTLYYYEYPQIYKPSPTPELCRPCDYMLYLKYHTDKPGGLILDLGGRHDLLTISLHTPLPIFRHSACTALLISQKHIDFDENFGFTFSSQFRRSLLIGP